jgi:hypothetical protein
MTQQNSSGEQDAFRKFIEDALDIGSLPDNPERLARLAAQYGYVHRPEEYQP